MKTPQTARTKQDLNALPRTAMETRRSWITVDEATVTVAEQRNGQPATGMVTLPKRTFDALIRWYQTGETRNLRTS